MAKTIGKSPLVKKKETQLIPEKYQDWFYLALIFVSVFIFFGSAIFGNGFDSSDNLSSMSFQTFLGQAKSSGNFPLWVPHIFSGMPSYGSLLTTGERVWDIIPLIIFGAIKYFGLFFGSDVARLAFYYFFYGAGIYLLMRNHDKERFVSFFSAAAAVFSTSVIIWLMIGHSTKPVVFAMFPFVIFFMEKLREKFSIIHTVLLAIVLHLMFEAGHLQMIFYGACTFGLYLVVELISRLISKNEPMKVIRSGVILAVTAGIAFSMSADRYLSTLEYTPYSVRGSAPIAQTADKHQDATGGNDYQYATMWSFSPGEMMTFMVPNYFGFGKLEYKGELTGGQEARIPTYWGQKPFEDAAPYMGAFVVLLALLGVFIYRKDAFVQFLAILSLFSLLLSFGYTFPIVYDFFFNFVPSFNKFRAPSMALAMLQFAVPILAGYGLSGIIKLRKESDPTLNKALNVYVIASGAFLVLGLLFSAMFQTTYMEAVASSKFYQQMAGAYGEEAGRIIQKFIWDSMTSDWLMTGGLVALAAIAIYLYAKNKLNTGMFYVALGLLLFVDMWRVGYRPMEVAKTKAEKTYFQKTDMIDFLQADKGKFRIADFVNQSPNLPAYYMLETVNGYHAAKLRVYQDMLDVADRGSTSQVTNPFLWNLLNVKYIITPQPLGGNIKPVFTSEQAQALVYVNNDMLPRALFVNKVEVAKQMAILQHLKTGDFNPRDLAFVEKQLPVTLDSAAGATVKITNYENERIKMNATATGNNLLLLSEVYYPAGWKAFIDGKETEVFKTNFAFRSIIVPKGNHTIEMKFESKGFETGKTLSIASNALLVILFGFGLFMERKTLFAKKEKAGEDKE